jgi:2'-5' RNA ligase
MPRLFSGIEIPDDIRQVLAELRQPLPATRWIEPENFHITLRFAGDITPPVANEFDANLSNISFDPFPVRITGLSTFGGDEPRTLFAAIEMTNALQDLARANEMAARRAGLPPDGRRFVPHVTLARFQTAPRLQPIVRFLERNGGLRLPAFTVTRFVLFSSKPLTGGGPYVVEHAYPSSIGHYDHDEWADWEDDNPPRLN